MSDTQDTTVVNENDILTWKGKNVSLIYIPSDIEGLRLSKEVVAWCDDPECAWVFKGIDLTGRQTPESVARTHAIRAAKSKVPTGSNGETYDIYVPPVPHRVSWVDASEQTDEQSILDDLNTIVKHIASYAEAKSVVIPALEGK